MSAVGRAQRQVRLEDASPQAAGRVLLGAILLRSQRITPDHLEEGLRETLRTGERLGEALVRKGLLTTEDIGRALAEQHGMEFVDVRTVAVDPAAFALLPSPVALRLSALPVRFTGDGVVVVVSDPTDEEALGELRRSIDRNVEFAVGDGASIDTWLRSSALDVD